MKYIHDGEDYVIFSNYSIDSHSYVARLSGMTPLHAGFLSYSISQETSEKANSYGKSVGLRLNSEPFDFKKVNYVGIGEDDFIVISNNKEILQRMECQDIQQAKWEISRPGNHGEEEVWYHAHPTRKMKACKLGNN